MMEQTRTRGEVYEGIAFQFCKIATVTLIAGRFALPVAAGACAVFYVMAIKNGKTDTRCWLRYPWLLVALWSVVCIASLSWILFPTEMRSLLPTGAQTSVCPRFADFSLPAS